MMEGFSGQSGDLQEMDCPYGFIALEAWFQNAYEKPSGRELRTGWVFLSSTLECTEWIQHRGIIEGESMDRYDSI